MLWEMKMTKEEELARAIEDRDYAEDEVRHLEQELADFEAAHPDDYESYDDWNALENEIRQLDNHAMYLTHCIESLREEIENG
jgi:predicted RNase H-like nuclease (RuvC/YqgF family)